MRALCRCLSLALQRHRRLFGFGVGAVVRLGVGVLVRVETDTQTDLRGAVGRQHWAGGGVAFRLTDRDRLLLDWLADHRVLTTFQISHALFGSLDFAQRRLLKLHRLGLVDRFRPLRAGGGSYPWHYVLDQVGAEFVAASRGERPLRRGETVERMRRIAASRTLRHRLGVNDFFTDLVGYARARPDCRLERWWSEQQCAQPGAFGTALISPVRPDGHGVFAEGGQRAAFFLEWDSGGEQLSVLASKLVGYARHVRQGGPSWPVLLWLPTSRRERHLHHILDEVDTVVPVATAARDSLDPRGCPADAVWLVCGAGDAPRRLADLAGLGDPAPELSEAA